MKIWQIHISYLSFKTKILQCHEMDIAVLIKLSELGFIFVPKLADVGNERSPWNGIFMEFC